LLPFVNAEWAHLKELRHQAGDKRGAGPTSGRAARLELIGPGESTAGSTWGELCGAYGLEARDPTWDKRLLEFCIGVPEHQYVRNGQHRWLIRRVMDGRMPHAVLWDPLRGRQAADIGPRIRASYDETRAALEQVKASALARQCLDLPKVESALEDLRREVTAAANDKAAEILMPGLGIGLFLLRL
jgi:asparagine synthase (glutamine-hydrolysing)